MQVWDLAEVVLKKIYSVWCTWQSLNLPEIASYWHQVVLMSFKNNDLQKKIVKTPVWNNQRKDTQTIIIATKWPQFRLLDYQKL